MAALCGLFASHVSSAEANSGYEPDPSTPVISLTGEGPMGVAVDQSNGRIYVAMAIGHFIAGEPGYIHQLEPNGTPTADSPFSTGAAPVFSGVAVDPTTHGVYGAEFIVNTPYGTFGQSTMVPFSSTGTMGTPFETHNSVDAPPQIAVDSGGRIFYPSKAAAAVQVFNGSGVVQETIECSGCPGGAFVEPSSVALDSADNLYIVDRSDGRVLKFTHSGGPYVYAGVEFQSEKHGVAVAVDSSNGSVIVGDYSGGSSYHMVAYEPTGEHKQFDDFGAGLFDEGLVPVEAQIAIDGSTHRLYVGEPKSNSLRVFDLVTIHPPTVSTEPATPVGQIEATLNAKVNANFHATTDCHFEYADDATFQEHGDFTGATQRACPSQASGSQDQIESIGLTTLTPDTKYHFRIVAANNAGTETSAPLEFTTLPEAPATVTTEAATGVGLGSAKLKGRVNSHGGTVSSCRIEYGTTTSYGKSMTCPTPVGISDTAVPESVAVGGLTPGTTYHYRVAVTSNAGSTNGADVDFTTLSPPAEEPEPEESAPPSGGSVTLLPPPSTPSTTTPKKRRLTCRRGFRKRRVHGKVRCVKKKHRKRKRAHRRHRRHHHRAH